jgi:hypothetical protein
MKRKMNMMAQLARMTQVLIVSPRAPNIGNPTELHQSITTRMAETAVTSGGGRCGGESSGQNRRRGRGGRGQKMNGVKGPVLLQRRRGHREAKSFTVRPEESNSTEQELSAVNRRIERRL